MVRGHLDHLPPNTLEEVRGYLLYHHGREMLRENRHAEAVPHLTEAVSLLRAWRQDTPDAWYVLATTCHVAGWFEEARHAAEKIADTTDELRARGGLNAPVQADACRLVVADGYRHLREHETALDHYGSLVAKAHEFDSHSTPLVAGALTDMAHLLGFLDREGEAAERFREAAGAHTAIGNPLGATACRCYEADCLMLSGDQEAALACLATAERAVQAVPDDPAPARASAQALLDETGANIMSDLGRRSEAVTLAARASAAYRHADDPWSAVEMDLLRVRLLFEDDRADLAEPLLRRVYEVCEEDDPRRARIANRLAELRSEPGHHESS